MFNKPKWRQRSDTFNLQYIAEFKIQIQIQM